MVTDVAFTALKRARLVFDIAQVERDAGRCIALCWYSRRLVDIYEEQEAEIKSFSERVAQFAQSHAAAVVEPYCRSPIELIFSHTMRVCHSAGTEELLGNTHCSTGDTILVVYKRCMDLLETLLLDASLTRFDEKNIQRVIVSLARRTLERRPQ